MTNCYIRFHCSRAFRGGSVVVRQRIDGGPDGEHGMLVHLRRFFLESREFGILLYPEEAASAYIVWRSIQHGRTLPVNVISYAADNLAIVSPDTREMIRYSYDVFVDEWIEGAGPRVVATMHDYSHTLPPEIRELARKADEANKAK